ncbi:polysaccharide deacetylase family protein [Sphingobacterium paucimobilis]|uniref:NodB homology domain-containing protein n=1 Tax=Sphingobacterium paucimobilis HER1398 TaxID=1346330 RepID=U2J743_9SPHI|nr:polysaccharide deacetylase family protein [Sphingobacterium paucimobilis]ERJ58478.1 hypothetical protein M472_06835 [Sphingobacterium paucimobilis HER1398]
MFRHKNIVPVLLSLGILAAILALFSVISWSWCFLLIMLWIGLTTWGSFDIRQSYFTDVFYKKARHDGRSLALTFDDGPTPITEDFLDLLKSYDAKATFFCIGKQINKHPRIFKRILEEGHTIGNHTMMHSKAFGFLTAEQVILEINSCDAVVNDLVPLKPRLFRPPFGVTNPPMAKAVQQTKHQVIGWSIRSLDTVLSNEDKIYERVVRRLQPGDIVLFHDTSVKTLRVLERVLVYMKERDWHSVTADELLNLHAYED